MKISIDAGALCPGSHHHFGTATVTQNILHTLSDDRDHEYIAYLYRRLSKDTTVAAHIRYSILRPSFGWMAARVSIEQMLHPTDIYLGLNQAIPWYTRAKVITLLHGLSFYFHKELYPDSYEALKDQVLFAISRSDVVFVPSARVKKELHEQFGFDRAIVNHFGVPLDMLGTSPTKRHSPKPYFLFVGMNHPIKNISFLVDAFTVLKSDPKMKDVELLLVGNHHDWEDARRGIRSVHPTRTQLPSLVSGAVGYLSASLYESFNLPVLEALAMGTPVIGKSSAIIQEMQSLVTIADELEDFVDAMRSVLQGKQRSIAADIDADYNWKLFCQRLKKNY